MTMLSHATALLSAAAPSLSVHSSTQNPLPRCRCRGSFSSRAVCPTSCRSRQTAERKQETETTNGLSEGDLPGIAAHREYCTFCNRCYREQALVVDSFFLHVSLPRLGLDQRKEARGAEEAPRVSQLFQLMTNRVQQLPDSRLTEASSDDPPRLRCNSHPHTRTHYDYLSCNINVYVIMLRTMGGSHVREVERGESVTRDAEITRCSAEPD